MQKCKAKCKIILFFFFIAIFNFYFLIFNMCSAYAEHMTSPNYKLEQTNLNMTSGKKSSSNFTVTDTVGQFAANKFTSTGFIVRAGFQYYYSIIPFRFSISKTNINFASVTAQNPVTDNATLTVSSGGAGGYRVTVSEDDQLRKNATVNIADTTCEAGDPCDWDNAKPWTTNLAYGFGYNMNGTDVPATFVDTTYFRPFPSLLDGKSPVTVMSGTNVGRSLVSTITFKLNVSNLQEAGQYQNILNFVATPTY